MQENYLVTQANRLIEARQKNPLTTREQKIILSMASMIQPDDDDFITYDISVSHFHKMMGLKGREKYTEIKQIMENLMSKVIEIPKQEGGWLLTHWVSVAEYVEGKGVIRLRFVPELKPYLLQLKKAFTSFRLSNILSLKSAYSIRLYELMKKWQQLGTWKSSIDELKPKLGVKQNSYVQYGHFKQRILNPSIRELNDQTDIEVQFDEIKNGRKVIEIIFHIKHVRSKEMAINKSVSDKATLFEHLKERATGYELTFSVLNNITSTAEAIYNQDEYEQQLERLVDLTNEKVKHGKIENPLGFMIYIIQEKEKEAEQMSNPTSIKIESKEVLPDWFENYNETQYQQKNKNLDKQTEEQEVTEVQELLDNLLEKEKNKRFE